MIVYGNGHRTPDGWKENITVLPSLIRDSDCPFPYSSMRFLSSSRVLNWLTTTPKTAFQKVYIFKYNE